MEAIFQKGLSVWLAAHKANWNPIYGEFQASEFLRVKHQGIMGFD